MAPAPGGDRSSSGSRTCRPSRAGASGRPACRRTTPLLGGPAAGGAGRGAPSSAGPAPQSRCRTARRRSTGPLHALTSTNWVVLHDRLDGKMPWPAEAGRAPQGVSAAARTRSAPWSSYPPDSCTLRPSTMRSPSASTDRCHRPMSTIARRRWQAAIGPCCSQRIIVNLHLRHLLISSNRSPASATRALQHQQLNLLPAGSDGGAQFQRSTTSWLHVRNPWDAARLMCQIALDTGDPGATLSNVLRPGAHSDLTTTQSFFFEWMHTGHASLNRFQGRAMQHRSRLAWGLEERVPRAFDTCRTPSAAERLDSDVSRAMERDVPRWSRLSSEGRKLPLPEHPGLVTGTLPTRSKIQRRSIRRFPASSSPQFHVHASASTPVSASTPLAGRGN